MSSNSSQVTWEHLYETLRNRGTEIEIMQQIASIVNAGLDRRVLAIVMELIEAGVHPESIADGKYTSHNLTSIMTSIYFNFLLFKFTVIQELRQS